MQGLEIRKQSINKLNFTNISNNNNNNDASIRNKKTIHK